MEQSEGNLDLFKQLLGQVTPEDTKKTTATPAPQPQKAVNEGPFPWGNEWLSVLNDFLFEEI